MPKTARKSSTKDPSELLGLLQRLKGPALQKALDSLTPEQLRQVEATLDLKTNPAKPGKADSYETRKERERQRQADMALTGRDTGTIPDIADVARRERCRTSLRAFCETYNPLSFQLAWSDDQLRAIARIEEAATRGALYAYAMPRGSGKSTIARHAALWATAYAICRYVFLIGSTEKKAEEALLAIKTFCRFLSLFAADFPEISIPVRHIGGIANKAGGQVCEGAPTLIQWSSDKLVFPTVPVPRNWPFGAPGWETRRDGMAPTSGGVLSAAGLTSEGLRGSLLTLSTGESIRPDLVLLDDPQTPESARSPAQNETRLQLISADVLGMAGPGKKISAVMPCTVIAHGDMVDTILDRKKHPLWRGERTRMLREMPTHMAEWDKYSEVYFECAQQEPPDFSRANDYYRSHRETLDDGCEATWPANVKPGDISAIQSAMNLYFRSPTAFASEYQNEPLVYDNSADELTADDIAAKTNGLPRGIVPLWAVRLTSFIDVQKTGLFWAVCAWDDQFTGHVVDYGCFPDQKRSYFILRDLNPKLADVTGVEGEEQQIYRGLTMCADLLLSRRFEREDGQIFRVEKLLIDANYKGDTIKQWCRESNRNEVYPTHGRFWGPSATPVDEMKPKKGERKGHHWLQRKHLLYDTNYWKSFIMARLSTAQPSRGCLTLFGDKPHTHRLFSEHLTAERRDQQESKSRGVEIDVWKEIPGRDNHWLDCVCGAAVAASVQGSALKEAAPVPTKARKRVSFQQQQREAQERRERQQRDGR